MIEKWLDAYELKARILPGLIVVFPLLIDALYAAPVLSSWSIFTMSGIGGLALIYTLGSRCSGSWRQNSKPALGELGRTSVHAIYAASRHLCWETPKTPDS